MSAGAFGALSVGADLVERYLGYERERDLIDAQNSANIQLWKLQTEYNTPANQVARFRAAGLNPNLIYGTGSASAGNASTPPHMEAASASKYQYSFGKLLDYMQVVLQMRNLNEQNQNLKAQTKDIEAQTRQRNAQANYDNAVLEFYRKHGYFPGQTAAPSNIVKEVVNQPFVRRSGEAVGEAVGEVVGRLSTNVDRDPDRAVKWAAKVADQKGLSGRERVDFINKFVDIYYKTH